MKAAIVGQLVHFSLLHGPKQGACGAAVVLRDVSTPEEPTRVKLLVLPDASDPGHRHEVTYAIAGELGDSEFAIGTYHVADDCLADEQPTYVDSPLAGLHVDLAHALSQVVEYFGEMEVGEVRGALDEFAKDIEREGVDRRRESAELLAQLGELRAQLQKLEGAVVAGVLPSQLIPAPAEPANGSTSEPTGTQTRKEA